jgi:RNA polymerase sigma factor (sigma-70 family)
MSAEAERLDHLARGYEHRVRFFARRISCSFRMGPSWHDDLVSAGYLGLAKALRNLRPGVSEAEISAYVSQRIIGAVMDEARTCITRNARGPLMAPALGDPSEAADRQPSPQRTAHGGTQRWQTPEHDALLRSARERTRRALSVLEPGQQRLIEAYMEGASLEEIARAEGVAPGTLRLRFQKILRRLRADAPDLRSLFRELTES